MRNALIFTPKRYDLLIIVTVIIFFAVVVYYILTPKHIDLKNSERSVFSQNGMDGVLEKTFEIIPPNNHFTVEFYTGNGIYQSNTRNLVIHHNWSALLLGKDEKLARELAKNYEHLDRVKTLNAAVYPGNVDLLLEENGVPKDLDLLVINIDSNDYYVWRAIHEFQPKVILIEFNPIFIPPQLAVIDYHPMNYWDHGIYYGASIQSMYELGKKKGYELIYANKESPYLLFVKKKYFRRFGIRDNSPASLQETSPDYLYIPNYALRSVTDLNGRPRPPYDKDLTYDEVRIKRKYVFHR